MQGEIWLNLPVRDVARSKEFFEKIGFRHKGDRDTPEMTCFVFGEQNTAVLLFAEARLREFAKSEIADARKGAEILISVGAGSRAEVDETARMVFDAGGTIFAEPAEIDGWMYGFGFQDLDGHRWNLLYMDNDSLKG
ncbi:MAG: extradiol dioxygenase [Acidobacteria bacterium]|nr:extradiol dioxygenase [Acidobacteriota bacterium]